MKASIPTIAPLLRSDVQGRLLAELTLFPDRQLTLSGLTSLVGSSAPTVHREVDRLVASGFLLESRSGRNRYVRANTAHSLYNPVRQIVEHAYGPGAVLPELLARLDHVEQAVIYGSWAARMAGVEGADPADIDVLVIGTPGRAGIFDAGVEAQRRLGREVNIQTVSPERWEAADDSFLTTVRSRPLVELELRQKATI